MIKADIEKTAWSGKVISVQPRIRLMRSFDERSYSHLGYVLRVEGTVGDKLGEFQIALGKAAQAKHRFRVGMEASGLAVPVPDPRLKTAGFFRASGLKILSDTEGGFPGRSAVLWRAPDLETYRSHGHRRLDTRTYDIKCTTCI